MTGNAIGADATLDDVRAAVARALPQQAAFDGWTPAARDNAARQAGIDPALAELALPGGATAMIDAWFATIDADMLAALPAEKLNAMKIRERIRSLVEARLDILIPNKEALRRALAILAFPANVPLATRLGWRSADVMWRAAGDTATDYNHYSKRTLLGGIYAATVLTMMDDESEGHADTRAFLGRRIDGVMRFEKAKARLTKPADHHFNLARFLGRLRYPAH